MFHALVFHQARIVASSVVASLRLFCSRMLAGVRARMPPARAAPGPRDRVHWEHADA
jgi:hypothetical protein